VELENFKGDDDVITDDGNKQLDLGNNQTNLQPQVKTEINPDANVNKILNNKVGALGIIE
jgi:hypothetical protein